jgi:hypothetical protein
MLWPVLRIHDILVWIRIRIRGSMLLTTESGFGSWIRILLFSQDANKNKFFKQNFLLNTVLFEGTFTSIFKDKKSKIVTK